MRRTRRTIAATAGVAAVLGLGGAGVAAALCAGSPAGAAKPGSIARSTHLVSAKSAGADDTVADDGDTSSTTASTTSSLPDTTTTLVSGDTSTTVEATTTTLAPATTTSTTVAGAHNGCDHHQGDKGALSTERDRGDDHDADDQGHPSGHEANFTVSTPGAHHGAPEGGDFGRRHPGGH